MKAVAWFYRTLVLSLPLLSCAGVDQHGTSGAGGGSGSGGARASTDAAAGDAIAYTSDAHCDLVVYQLGRDLPDLLLLLDRASSMSDPLGAAGGPTRWSAVATAGAQVLAASESTVAWGLKLFPDADSSCAVSGGVDVPPAVDDADPVSDALAPAAPAADGAPTSLVVQRASAYLQALGTAAPKYLLLITDGDRSCPSVAAAADAGAGADGGDSDGGGDGDDQAVASIAAAAAAGIPTAVVGLSFSASQTPNDQEVGLHQMAVAGGMGRAGGPPDYYPVSSIADLATALSTIATEVGSCTFRLDNPPPSPPDVAVGLNGKRLARDQTHLQGWDYGVGMASVVVFGEACQSIAGAGAAADLEITFGCSGALIP
jgi:hypothetical protein